MTGVTVSSSSSKTISPSVNSGSGGGVERSFLIVFLSSMTICSFSSSPVASIISLSGETFFRGISGCSSRCGSAVDRAVLRLWPMLSKYKSNFLECQPQIRKCVDNETRAVVQTMRRLCSCQLIPERENPQIHSIDTTAAF
jgi:hypothetical protein